jgi:hypothetical protein
MILSWALSKLKSQSLRLFEGRRGCRFRWREGGHILNNALLGKHCSVTKFELMRIGADSITSEKLYLYIYIYMFFWTNLTFSWVNCRQSIPWSIWGWRGWRHPWPKGYQLWTNLLTGISTIFYFFWKNFMFILSKLLNVNLWIYFEDWRGWRYVATVNSAWQGYFANS